LKIIIGVIAVIGSGGKNRVEIEGIDAQLLEIIQLIHDPMEVSPLKALLLRRAAPGLKPNSSRMPGPGTPGKTIRKNLIKDGIFCPGRGVYSHQAKSSCHYLFMMKGYQVYFSLHRDKVQKEFYGAFAENVILNRR
jgi:hypothetical protein